MKSLIFDLDGTLINSLLDIALSMNKVLEKHGYASHEIDKYNHFVGDGALVLVKNAMPKDATENEIKVALKSFIEIYEQNTHNNTFAYEGIYEMLEKLERLKIKKAILSNKPHKFTLKYMENLFNNFHFQEIHGQKVDVPKKPDPTMAIEIATKLNTKIEDMIFVGDTATDMKTAKNAGMIAVGVEWGFRTVEELLENGADFIVKTPQDIIEILNKLK
ncbi:HAD-superfamily hydrolase, subfamily IA, variant 1 [Arcobacter nitrofigilis DSM 7299]|uniref:phosphoglycolate phosphatase n=1 Tax=Arcobacter nitrofigilis (strain ATCC 33309 / DSM 7299 / CCUG 15893 / LMG 7604 / NCTC 12251 / CI) TaxID=572480 RepID=D5V7U3_ARCNC|nr:HAD family hydrolase [Arcobacter nitrofigilis]ADG94713.1 HAD-superfamily hydrolase, subfamily IA, variant 1 [Arcobacter nitrofigilis DSM 7299]